MLSVGFIALGLWLASSDTFWISLISYSIILFFVLGAISLLKIAYYSVKANWRFRNDPDGFVASFLQLYNAGGSSEEEKEVIGLQMYKLEKERLMKSRHGDDESDIEHEAAQNVRSKYPDLYPEEGE